MSKSRRVYKKRITPKKNTTKRCVYTDEGKKMLKIIKHLTKNIKTKKNKPI
jgi:hypothetical protein